MPNYKSSLGEASFKHIFEQQKQLVIINLIFKSFAKLWKHFEATS